MQYANRYDNEEDLVCPVKYFKEEFALLNSLDDNELLTAIGKKKKVEISRKLAKAVRSLAGLMLENHSVGIACGDALKLSNLRISRSLGEFVMVEQPQRSEDRKDNLLGDFSRCADVLEELVRLVLGPDVVMPIVWHDFIDKLREKFPRVELIIYHSMFLPMNLRYCLLVIVDQIFRKDFHSLKKEEKDAIREFLKKLGEMRKEDVDKLVADNEFMNFLSLRSRSGSRIRKGELKGKSNSDLSQTEKVCSDKARDIIAYARDGLVHGCKKDPSQKEKDAMPNIRNHWRTQKNIIQLLAEVFELLEQNYLDLCYDSKYKILWTVVGIPELFGETGETWKAAVDAIAQAIEEVKAERSTK